MAYTKMALKTSEELLQTYCIRCSCMGNFKGPNGEHFIVSNDDKLEPEALTADRICHCATCWQGCETLAERTERICFYGIKSDLLRDGFAAAKKADESLESLGTDWSRPDVQHVVLEAETAITHAIYHIMQT